MRRAPATVLVFVLLFLVALALHPGTVDNVDSRIILRTATQLADHGTFALGDVGGTYFGSAEYGGRGIDGELYMKFGPGNAVLDLPFLLLGRLLLVPAGLDAERAGEAAVAFASCLWFALAGVLLLRIARRTLSPRPALVTTLLWAFTTYAVVYARSAYLEGALTVAVLLAWDRALRCREEDAGPGPALVLGFACGAVLWIKLAGVLHLFGLPLLFLRPGGLRALLRTVFVAALPFGVLAALHGVLNASRFGSPLEFGYAASLKFDNPLLAGIVSLLVGERGLLFHAPLALAGILSLPLLARRDRGTALGIGVVVVASLALHATFFSSFGGDAWGPRYLVPAAALLAVPAGVGVVAALRAGGVPRIAAGALVAAGLVFQIAPSVTSFRDHWSLREHGADGRPPGPTLARIAVARAFGDEPYYDLRSLRMPHAKAERVRMGVPGLDLWPVRVGRELSGAGPLAWVAWGFVVLSAGAAGAAVVGRLRDYGRLGAGRPA